MSKTSMRFEVKSFIAQVLVRRVPPPSWQWFNEALLATSGSVSTNRLLSAYTAMSRKLGKRVLALSPAERQELHHIHPLMTLSHWGMDEAGRAVLLLSLAENVEDPVEYGEFVLECYDKGDTREQQSWLRSLCLLPGCEQFVDAATDACRTNIIPLFESIACENPYASKHFPQLNFNQMVMQALFNVIPISRIVGLDELFNPELSRMADEYVDEREAAGRPLPQDIWLAIVPHVHTSSMERVYHYLGHDDPQHRLWAARALASRNDEGSVAALERQQSVESDAELAATMNDSLRKMKDDLKGVRP